MPKNLFLTLVIFHQIFIFRCPQNPHHVCVSRPQCQYGNFAMPIWELCNANMGTLQCQYGNLDDQKMRWKPASRLAFFKTPKMVRYLSAMAVASPIEAATRQRKKKKNAMDSDSLAIAPCKNKKKTVGNFFIFFFKSETYLL